MDILEVIRTRKSVRTFDGRDISESDKEKLFECIESMTNPYDIPVEFVWLDAEELGLSSPVIAGEKAYIAAKVPNCEHCAEAFGYTFEKMVLCAWSLGIGTTWIGGTMDRALFEQAAGASDEELMMVVTPVGYPAAVPSETDSKLREMVRGDERLPASEIFFDKEFGTPLVDEAGEYADVIEAVRWAPSAVNIQPWRIVKDENKYHFYEKHQGGYTPGDRWDVQKVDVGIAICHFMSAAGGTFEIANPGIDIPDDTEYIATVVL